MSDATPQPATPADTGIDAITGADADVFERHRRHLRGLAYRMLGSRAEAEDVVQDTWLRWQASAPQALGDTRAYLSQIATRLCLDRIKSAQWQREQYVGAWLPEPVVEEAGYFDAGPEAVTQLASDLSFAFLLALQRLTPLERAAFLLLDVFDMDMPDVAQMLARSPQACRQLLSRARTHIGQDKVRADLDEGMRMRLSMAFAQALAGGDLVALARTLAEDTVFISDGGGKVNAAPRPIHGAERVAKALYGFYRLADMSRMVVRPASINGLSGVVMNELDGTPIQTMAWAFDAAGAIEAIYVVRNPDKLRHLRFTPGATA
jgi:RNA polymerase sigma-70 factor (ECF subfamily)